MAEKVQEIHGVANIERTTWLPHETDHRTQLRIRDSGDKVVVFIPKESAALTPDEARYIARQLEASAARVEEAEV